MSKVLYIIYRKSDKKIVDSDKKIFQIIEQRILPDNIVPNKMKLLETRDSLATIYNPVSTIKIEGTSLCLGYSPNSNWHVMNKCGGDLDGSFAILRNNNNFFQIVSDMVASRTLWYYFNESVFIVSTSQRAIVSYLGNFEFDARIIPWMLASGTIGPGFSYDKRLQMVKANSLITLDKASWTIDIDTKKIKLNKFNGSKCDAKRILIETLEHVFTNLQLDKSKFILPLSGGYDSRGILLFLTNINRLKTVTWGSAESRNNKESDSFIAKELAEKLQVENVFFESYNSSTPIKEILSRFLICSEGRIDHIGGYLDGMQMWKTFFESKYETIIRGEELLGLSIAKSFFIARREEGLTFLSDYYNIDNSIIKALEKQTIPAEWYNNDIYTYKGYLALNYEHPVIFAALNDIKTAYTEVFSPLLSSSIINVISTMFDERIIGNKKIFKEIVIDRCPDIPLASQGSNKQISDLFYTSEFISEINKTFNKAIENNYFQNDLIQYTLKKINIKPNEKINKNKNLTSQLKNLLPKKIVELIKSKSSKREMNWQNFTFRLYILIKMKELFLNDSHLRKNENSNS